MSELATTIKKRPFVIGLLAHVDAGKTTLSEALLYHCGEIRKLGRVDHKDAFLDHFSVERERGITVFSKQASFMYKDRKFILLDTPGHVDFSAEMERTLQVLDLAVLVISGADGVEAHTLTLWKLLQKYKIPAILFVNKMDQQGIDREKLIHNLKKKLSSECISFAPADETDSESRGNFYEELAMTDELLLEEFMESQKLQQSSIAKAVMARHIFPVFFGSALLLQGVEELLEGLYAYSYPKDYGQEFGARVYKITRDDSGNRLTHLKITGGMLKAKMLVNTGTQQDSPDKENLEKVDTLRLVEGSTYRITDRVEAGEICAVSGLKNTFPGQGLGMEKENNKPLLIPVLTYQVVLPDGADPIRVLAQLRSIEEEEPELHVVWKESLREIQVQVMGEVQLEIYKRILQDRFGLDVAFADGRLLYQETIRNTVEGVGHFEPLRHYAEVHLLMEPGEPGSGIRLQSTVKEEDLDKNWQRLIFTHLEEKTHLGVLTGSHITDMKITLCAGRAHLKHTEGGDFRQATYRAVRQGLMQAESVLLEPVYSFTLEVPTQMIGRAMTDIKKMSGDFESPVMDGETAVLTGTCPVATMNGYQRELNSYSRGLGQLQCTLKGYEPCHNTQEVLEQFSYDPEGDTENPSSSVFCSHGAGFVVNWREVKSFAHLPCIQDFSKEEESEDTYRPIPDSVTPSQTGSGKKDYITGEEIDRIFRETYKKSTEDYTPFRYSNSAGKGVYGVEKPKEKEYVYKPVEKKEAFFLVDGYNVIFAWEDLRELAKDNIDSARDRLMDICCDYQGYIGDTLILVFDAYKVKGNPGSVLKFHNIYVIFTKEAETADQYIERAVHRLPRDSTVTVVSSDGLVQTIIWGAGASRMSSLGFREAIREVKKAYENK